MSGRDIIRARADEDLVPGDFVRRIGARDVGLVESVKEGHACVSWGRGRRDILPVGAFRHCSYRGSSFDRRAL